MSIKNVVKLSNSIYVKDIDPAKFEVEVCDCPKRDIKDVPNYFNLGYFAKEANGKTVTIGNVVANGKVLSVASLNADRINLANKSLTTIYITEDGGCGIVKAKNLNRVLDVRCAISGIPIVRNGKKVAMSSIKAEGYFGDELYNTWHGFLGIRNEKLVYVAMKCDYDLMYTNLMALGIHNAIKLDGGGSFILKEGDILQSTSGNRRINSIGTW